jgi:hypothetical protein
MSRLVFICGSFEPGRDGVGDYVRRLSEALLNEGHKVMVVALNDRHVLERISSLLYFNGKELHVFRIPTHAYRKAGALTEVREVIKDFNPDVISLQFVPYSFHKKGIPLNFPVKISNLINQADFHILFHEMWLDRPKGWRQQLVIAVQKLVVVLLTKLNPVKIHVTTEFNKHRLKRIGVHADLLSLFGNIPKADKAVLPIAISAAVEAATCSLLYFGSPVLGDFVKVFSDGVKAFIDSTSRPVSIFLVCGNSSSKNDFIHAIEDGLYGYAYSLVDCGFLSEASLSELMSRCDVGISRSNTNLIGKSGVTFSMLEHGLPVWIPLWDGQEPLDIAFRAGLVYASLEDAVQAERIHEYQSLLPAVMKQFYESIRNEVITS